MKKWHSLGAIAILSLEGIMDVPHAVSLTTFRLLLQVMKVLGEYIEFNI